MRIVKLTLLVSFPLNRVCR